MCPHTLLHMCRHMCPHTLLHMCRHMCPHTLLHMCRHMCPHKQLHMCPHTRLRRRRSSSCTCPHTLLYMCPHMCPHTTTYVSSCPFEAPLELMYAARACAQRQRRWRFVRKEARELACWRCYVCVRILLYIYVSSYYCIDVSSY
jgi:hypothetical protein